MSCSAPQAGDEAPWADCDGDDALADEDDTCQLEKRMSDRRRAQSLPACPAALLAAVARSNGPKRVKFADSMGLSLASVKHFSSLEEPHVPSKVFSRHASFPPQGDLLGVLDHHFDLPEPHDPDGRVRRLRVCLEQLSVTQFDVRGHVRVLSGGAHTEVGVRYTFNDWLSHVDAQALLEEAELPGGTGARYGFTMYTPPFMEPGSAVHFAVYLRGDEGEFWDNNDGRNFTLRYRGLHEHFVCAP
ncbi:protein phosphatase 1 regulatory subunit 3G [Entelurus aequoreus]|uniref:protein phosphatase 1 regulatory subunit 3G n=1 Tax=Entelurus aequoreus TaxID=161455 RepID=UPI002B1D8E10|nr:protein phosphatase 1 regulatory subunit 3G [Entelurus aequoreus]